MATKKKVKRSASKDQIIPRIKELAWTGQHGAAIDAATAALETVGAGSPRLGKGRENLAPTQMSLLDLRSESYIALGKLELAMQDAKAMMKLAKANQKSSIENRKLSPIALNRLSLVQMRTGDLKGALKSATAAIKARSGNRQLHAESLFRLSEAQFRTRQGEAAIESAQKAISIYQELGDESGVGRAYWAMALGFHTLNRAQELRLSAQTALELCKRAGDQYGVGNALIGLSNTDVDIAERVRHHQQALNAFKIAGYSDRQAVVIGNLGITYLEMGLYAYAQRLQYEVIEMNRKSGAMVGLTYALANLIAVEIILGNLDTARHHMKEFENLVPKLGDPNQEANLFLQQAELSFANSDLKTAIRKYKSALKIDRDEQTGSEHTTLTELAKMQLAAGDHASALKATTKATALHRAQNFAKPDGFTSQAIWWRHTQTLNANKKSKEARETLERAYDFLLEQIGNIRDAGLRRNALNKVEDNRKLLQFWVQDGAKRKLPKERLFAHLAIESNLREPFQRLTDTGLRLNALHTLERIQNFLVEEATELIGGERVMLILERSADFSRHVKEPTKVGTTREVTREVAESILPLPSYQSGKGYEKAEDPKDVLKRIGKYLDQARLTRTVQLTLPLKSASTAKHAKSAKNNKDSLSGLRDLRGSSILVAPLIAQNQILGYLYVDMDSLYGTFDETDRDMLGMLANQGAVALDNAGLITGLEQKVEERTAELQERISEMEIINSIQQGLASELDFQSIIDLVGDKLSEVLNTGDLGIRWYDEKSNLIHYLYEYEHGKRLTVPPTRARREGGPFDFILRTRKPLVMNSADFNERFDLATIPGTDQSKSLIIVPIISSDRVLGTIQLEDYEYENAYGKAETRLLTTIAASLGTALENARLFNETQHLLKVTEERNAELAIINSVQAALAAELNIQGIYNAVGEKISEIFKGKDVGIRIYDPKTRMEHFPYTTENGKLIEIDSEAVGDKGFGPHVYHTRETIVVNENMEAMMEKYGSYLFPGTETQKSAIYVPLVIGTQARGLIELVDMKQEHAFSESDVRLLQTLANSMSVALENARLFDETQRLLKITEDRAAELAIINSISKSMGQSLDVKTLTYTVGEKVRSIFNGDVVDVLLYDADTNMVSLVYSYFDEQYYYDEPPWELGEGLTSRVIMSRQPLLLHTAEELEQHGAAAYLNSPKEGKDPESYLGVPILMGEKVLGVVDVQSYQKYAFNEDNVRLLQTLSTNIGTALENARLFEETQRLFLAEQERVSELQIINSIQQGLAAELDFQAIVDLVGDQLRALFTTPDVGIRWYDDTKNLIYPLYEFEDGVRLFPEPETPSKEGQFAKLQKTRQPQIWGTEDEGDSVAVNIPGTRKSKSGATVPIITGDRLIGNISIEDYEREHAYGPSELRLLTTIAAALGTALENARLFNETQRLLKETEQRAQEISIINSISQALTQELDLQSLTNLVGDKLRTAIQTQNIGIGLYDKTTGLLTSIYTYRNEERVHPAPARLNPISLRLARQGKSLVLNDVTPDVWKKFGSNLTFGKGIPKSVVMTPILTGGELIGGITVQDFKSKNAYPSSMVRVLETIASNMGAAMRNARLFDETQRLLKETEQQNAELGVINSVQQALVSNLDLKSIYQSVGRKLCEIFNVQSAAIYTIDTESKIVNYEFAFEQGREWEIQPKPFTGLHYHIVQQVIKTKKTFVLNSGFEEFASKFPDFKSSRSQLPKSLCAVPILIRKNIVIGISLQQLDTENYFTESAARLLETIASAAGVAIENARLFGETQRLLKETEERAAELSILNNISEALTSTLDIKTLTYSVGDKVREVFSAEIVDILMYDPASNKVNLAYSYFERYFEDEPPWELDSGLTARVIRSRKPLQLDTADEVEKAGAQAYLTAMDETEDVQSYLGVPIMVGEKVLGVIDVQSFRKYAFNQNNLRLLQTLASNMGVALENARLFNETQRLLKESEKRAAELGAISTVTQALVAENELDNMIQLIGSQTRNIFDADIAYLALLDPSTKTINFPYTYGEDNIKPIKLGQGLTSRILESGTPLLINKDIAERRAALNTQRVGKGALAYLGVPIKSGKDTIGVLSVQSTTEENAFDNDDLRLLTTIAANAGAAIHTAQLNAETQRRAREMATLAEVGRDISSSLEASTVLENIATYAMNLLHGDLSALFIPEDDGKIFRAIAAVGEDAENIRNEIVELGKGLLGSIAESKVAEIINDANSDPRAVTITGTEDFPNEHVLVVPLLANQDLKGLMAVWRSGEGLEFTEFELEFMNNLARQAVIAIQNARLFDETQQSLKYQKALSEASMSVSSSLDLDVILNSLTRQVCLALDGTSAYISLVERNTDNWEVRTEFISDNASDTERESDLGASYNRDLQPPDIAYLKTGRSIIHHVDSADVQPNYKDHMQRYGAKSILSSPFVLNGRIIGFLEVWESRRRRDFNTNEINLCESLCQQAVIAIKNTSLFEDAQEARAAAEQANKAKSTFLANMSHELRTPLNAIIGFTRIVKKKSEGVLPEKQVENLEKVLVSSEHLHGLINTVLDIAKIEAGRMDVIPNNFNISALAESCATLAIPLLKPGVTLEKQSDNTLGLIYSDQDKIKQILLNLLSNAAKFTPEGNIILSVSKKDEQMLNVSVKDSGIGISEEALGRVFEEFQQADTSTTRQYGGTGLGLAISRNLARLLGGDLTATSELGKGSTFTLTIPIQYGSKPASADLRPAPHRKAATATLVHSNKKRILVIDDDPNAEYFLQESLNVADFDITGARNGSDGLKIAREQQPDAILLDILMPETDGWQVLNDLKEDPKTTNIPVILLTIVDKKALGFRLGAAAYLLKPLNPSNVLDTLQRVIGGGAGGQRRVLVVDDDPQVCDMLRQTLPDSNFELDTAEDGEAGLRAVEAKRPDVILLDLMMPKVDGFGVIESLRGNPEFRNIPIIVISAKELTDDESRRLKQSVSFVMRKQGFDSEKLIQELHSVLNTSN